MSRSSKKSINPFEPVINGYIQLQRAKLGEIPMNILNTMDALYKDKENRPLLIKDGVSKSESGWNFIFTLNPGCDYKELESKLSYFQSVVSGTVEIKRKDDKYAHINVSDWQWEETYGFNTITEKHIKKLKGMYMPIPIGIKTGGKLLFEDMLKFSHLMVGGVQNSGKSSWIRQLIMFLKKYFPHVKIVYIDFMRLDAAPFQDIVYLGKDIHEAHLLLKLACMETDRRLDILEKARCFKASEYKGEEQINPLLVIIDELAEMEDKDSQQMLEHLARTARKCGVHLITSLQRPSHTTYKNFTSSRSQFPARLSFRMSEALDSEIILGRGNQKAYNLNKTGRAIWQYNNEEEIQSIFIDEHELENMIDNLISKGGTVIHEHKQNLWTLPR